MSSKKPPLVFIEQKINELHKCLIVHKKLNSSRSLVDYLKRKINELHKLSAEQLFMYDQGISYHEIVCYFEKKYPKFDVKHSLALYHRAKTDYEKFSLLFSIHLSQNRSS